jgi:fatty acid CoA ligase FadD9
MVPGYFEDPVASRSLFDANGYMRTGDVVEQRGNDLVWIDRVDDVVKVAEGTFVEIARLESLYAAGSPFISQIYLQASARGGSIVAAVVPSAAAMDRGQPHDVKRLLLDELRRIGGEGRLRAHEIPRDCFVVAEPFNLENGFLTGSGKLARHRIKAAMGAQLDALVDGEATASPVAGNAILGEADRTIIRPFVSAAWRGREIPDDVPLGPRGLALDSMALLEALLACEAHFGVKLSVRDLNAAPGSDATLTHLITRIWQLT